MAAAGGSSDRDALARPSLSAAAHSRPSCCVSRQFNTLNIATPTMLQLLIAGQIIAIIKVGPGLLRSLGLWLAKAKKRQWTALQTLNAAEQANRGSWH